MYQFLDE
jgi:hypothetical protein